MESGELTKIQNKWWYDQTKCNTLGGKPHELSNNGLMLNNLAGLFFVLIGGLMISLLVAVIEFCFKHGDTKNKQQKYKNKSTAATVNTLQAKSKLTIQQGRDFDNGRVGVGFAFQFQLINIYKIEQQRKRTHFGYLCCDN